MEDHQIQVNSGCRTEFIFPVDLDAYCLVVLRSRSGIGVRCCQSGSLILEPSVHRKQRKRFARLAAKSKAMGIDEVAHRHFIIEDTGGEIDRNCGNIAADAVAHPEANECHLRKAPDRGNGYVTDGCLSSEDIAYGQLRNGNRENARFELSVLEMILQTGRGTRDDGSDTPK